MDPLTALRKQGGPKAESPSPAHASSASPAAAVSAAVPVAAVPLRAGYASSVPTAVATAVASPVATAAVGHSQAQALSGQVQGSRPSFEGSLVGEQVVEQVKSCNLLVQNPFCEVPGRLQMTPYRLKFMIPKGSLRKELQWMRAAKYFDVPFGVVESAKEETSTSATGQTVYKLTVTTKDLRVLSFLVPTDAEMRLISDAVAAFGCPGNPAMLFASKHFEALKKEGALQVPDSGWCLYDPIQDYARMGIDTELIPNPQCPWRVSELNCHYNLCSTYPSVLVLPRRMPDQALREVAGFRKKGRLPALSWCGGPELGFASLWRCSQTTEGLMGQKCMEDQAMLNAIRLGAGKDRDSRELLLIDLRPRMNAWVNKAGGGGFEAYPNCRVIFGGIDNIHAVRDAWRGMGMAVHNICEGHVGSWFKDVANSGWYDYIGAILSSTLKVVEEIMSFKASVVIHCSDGWDRTAQVASLAMLCLDPYYRTQEGFLKLVQKEFCAFGHRFRTRLAIGEQTTAEYSPVFIQWLECVFQLQQQFPDAFEFSPQVLLRLSEEVFTNRYGTFFCDNEQERRKVENHTLSLWSALLQPEERETWRSAAYRAERVQMLPSLCQANYTIWEAYWFRFHPRGVAGAAEPPSPTKKSDADDPFAPTFLGPASSPASAPPAVLEAAPSASPLSAEPSSPSSEQAPAGAGALFSAAELVAPRRPAPALFTEDDEDVFAKHAKPKASEPPAAAEGPGQA